MMIYPNIDVKKTGINLKKLVKTAGYDVKYIQNYLHLSCRRPVYRWFKDKVLPSVDHLYALSVLLGVHMEELLVPKMSHTAYEIEERIKDAQVKRLYCYYEQMKKAA